MARPATRGGRGRKSNVISVDFSDVESAGAISDGWAKGLVKKAELTEAKTSGEPMVVVQWGASRGKEKAGVYDNLSLQPQALWRFKTMLEACGYAVEEGAMDIDPDDLIDLEADIQIVNDDSYDGRDRPKIAGYAPLGTHTAKKGGGKAERDEEPEDDVEERPTRRTRVVDEEDDPPRRRGKDADEEEEETPRSRKGKRDEEEEPEEEEEEAPRRKKGGKSKLRAGDKVTFEHRKKTLKGVVEAIDGDTIVVSTADGSEYELGLDEVEVV